MKMSAGGERWERGGDTSQIKVAPKQSSLARPRPAGVGGLFSSFIHLITKYDPVIGIYEKLF